MRPPACAFSARRRALPLAIALALCAGLGATRVRGVLAEELAVPADKSQIVMNFEDVELTAFIKFISKVTSRNFVFSDKVIGNVSVVSPTPVSPEQAYVLFQSVLSTQGLTTIDEGMVTRIVPIKDARTSGATVLSGNDLSAGFATRLLPLRYVTAADVARVLAPQISKDGSIVPYEGTNTVIVSDTAANLSRIAEMVAVMDIPGHEEVVAVVHLKHADAVRTTDQIVEILLGDQSGAGGGGGRRKGADKERPATTTSGLHLGFKITPDERTNSLIIMAPAAELRRIRALAESLDVQLDPGEERVHVYYAKNADAESLVEVVSGMLLGGKGKSRRDRQRDSQSSSASSAAPLGLPGASSSTPPSASDENLSITADPATNAVIVDAPTQQWKVILGLLEKLDISRPQVFIEGIIIEASANTSKVLGFDLQAVIDTGNGAMLARSNLGSINNFFANPLSLAGLVAAAASDKTVLLPDGTEVPANVALFQALQSATDVEVLSAPTLLTLDNQEAEIIVGQNIPFITGQTSSLTNTSNVFTQIERKDVGIKLRVRPQVAEGEVVVLDVQEEVSALVANRLLDENIAEVGPTTTIRSATTSVSVKDGRTVVIGGLMSTRTIGGESKVPWLGDIPGLGRLFRYNRKDGEKVNLIVFLTPHVIRTPKDLDTISARRRETFRAGLQDPATGLPGDPSPQEPLQTSAGNTVPRTAATAPAAASASSRPAAAPAATTKTAAASAAVSPPAVARGHAAPAAAAEPPPAAESDTGRGQSTYRHATDDKNNHMFPLNRDGRERAAF
ncbi:MAG: type II secretion system secretin GspD [Deltaproteobacteria bacterium]|nr:type II secretion system secretin GspD [Deltaproteobacteria bacterium]